MAKKKKAKAKESQVDRWYNSLQAYKHRSNVVSCLTWLLRRMDFRGFQPANPADLDAIISWLRRERQEHIDRVQSQAQSQAQAMSANGQQPTPTAPQIPDDTPVMIDRTIIALVDIKPGKDARAAIEKTVTASELSLQETMQMMIEDAQIGLEKVKLLICRAAPKWGMAGDILMPMWKYLIEDGIKHEICMRYKPVDPETIEQFGGDITLDDLYIETRAERAERESRERAEKRNKRR